MGYKDRLRDPKRGGGEGGVTNQDLAVKEKRLRSPMAEKK